jgi:hypothetical protein
MALAHQALAHWVEAEIDLTGALAQSEDPWIARNRASLEQALREVRDSLGAIDIEYDVAGAELWVNGIRMTSPPSEAPVRVTAGRNAIEVRTKDTTTSLVRDVAPGAVVRERVCPEPLVETKLASPVAAIPLRDDVRPASILTTRPSGRRTAGLVALGGAVALAGAAIGGIASAYLLLSSRSAGSAHALKVDVTTSAFQITFTNEM